LPKLFTLAEAAPRASDKELDQLEKLLNLRLPNSHKQFLKLFGSGDFGRTVVFCADLGSDWYLIKKYDETKS
jgi:hypothetical protein